MGGAMMSGGAMAARPAGGSYDLESAIEVDFTQVLAMAKKDEVKKDAAPAAPKKDEAPKDDTKPSDKPKDEGPPVSDQP